MIALSPQIKFPPADESCGLDQGLNGLAGAHRNNDRRERDEVSMIEAALSDRLAGFNVLTDGAQE